MPHNADSTIHHSILTKLRALVPHRHLSIEEALRIAELQATHLLALQHIDEAPVPSEVITELPKLRVEYANTPVSGACFWDGHDWVIELNPGRHTRGDASYLPTSTNTSSIMASRDSCTRPKSVATDSITPSTRPTTS